MAELASLEKVVTKVVGDGTLLTIQPGGNHGDTLIYKGAEKLFNDIGVHTTPFGKGEVRCDSPPRFELNGAEGVYNSARRVISELLYIKKGFSGDISAIYIHGGGNFNDLWGSGVRSYKLSSKYFDVPIIIGPQSCQFTQTDPQKLFEDVDNDIHFFCRGKYSYDLMSKLKSIDRFNLYLEDDTALYLNKEDLPVREYAEDYNLVAFRTDKESVGVHIDETINPPVCVRDISVSEDKLIDFINSGSRASKIYTDRLHGAILAAILEKPVRLYDNSYHKNKEVYKNSLEDKNDVEFVYKQ